jgi:hypothetical protein
MQTIIDGATAILTLQVLDEKGAPRPVADWTMSAEWRAGTGVTPATPIITDVDTYTRMAVADSAGLGGRTATLRAVAEDQVSGKKLKADLEYLVKA